MTQELNTLKQWISEAKKIVFFGGAGVSTESGIKDFRSKDGLYSMKFKYPPETMLSHTFYEDHTLEFFEFYRDKLMPMDAKPNPAHYKLAQWEDEGKLLAVITQNVDGLHTMAGSKTVYELHGSYLRNYCERCGKSYSAQFIKDAPGVPHCTCGGIVKPDVVLYEESLDDQVMLKAVKAIGAADVFIIGGTSLTVYPAAGLIRYYQGKRLVLINRDETPYDSKADLVLHEPIGQVFSQL